MKIEIWRDIKGYEGYQVSSFGRVRSFRTRGLGGMSDNYKLLKLDLTKTHCKEYYRATLLGKKFYVHRLVMLAFATNHQNKPQVNHKDNNGLNNDLDNLEWATNSENQVHRFKIRGTYSNYGQYVYKNRTTFRVNKKGVVDRCFKNLNEAQTFAKQYY
jgi:hypothetical protein